MSGNGNRPSLRSRHKPVERLGNSSQFRMVLSRGVRRSSTNFSIRAMPNGLSEPRLGMIAAKKVAKRAVDRNRGKRLVRELFRLRRAHVLPFDIVVEFRRDLRKLNCTVLRGEISALLDKLAIVEASGTFKLP